MKKGCLFLAVCALVFGLAVGNAQAATEIEWWHAMGGVLGERVNEICAGFNASQSEYIVKPVYKRPV